MITDWAAHCSAEIAVAVVGGAWKPVILHELELREVLRFGELSRAIGDPSPRVLTRQLRELEQDGIIDRRVYAEVPPRVEYRLTALGHSAGQALDAMAAWGRQYAAWHRTRTDGDSC